MSLLSAFLFSISANIDVFLIGMSHGMQKQRITFQDNLVISVITFVGTVAAIIAGHSFASVIPGKIARISGSVLLLLLGSYYCVKYLLSLMGKKRGQTHSLTSPSKSKVQKNAPQTGTFASKKSLLFLGIFLALNNAGMGIGASFNGIPILPTSLLTLLFSASFLWAGNRLGARWMPDCLKSYGELCSGVTIILLGIVGLW